MKKATILAVYLAALLCAVMLVPAAAQELPVLLEVRTENRVLYVDDDPTRPG